MGGPRRPFACVVGARPNLVKAAPLLRALSAAGLESWVVHTGQHYDHEMSRVFFDELDLPEPDAFLGVGSGSHGVQTANALIRLEEWLMANPVEAVLAIGDVNSTLAAALAAVKLHVPVVHVEAGYRSGDMKMPEEVNRLVTDHIAQVLLAPTRDARENLEREGIEPERIELVGNLMAETFLRYRDRAEAAHPWEAHGLKPGEYLLATVHRPENADDPTRLERICTELAGQGLPVLWPVHPRTQELLASVPAASAIRLTRPIPYLEMIGLLTGARAVVTDSGGVQEEACLAHVPCVTVRTSTERVATIRAGANRLAEPEDVGAALHEAAAGTHDWPVPDRWDDQVGKRSAEVLGRLVSGS
ncbi:MAG: UDP-N-acetylglucosamine 2-epimerase (non-hydrolyzing) [Actinobacteria bacterium]|nr:UDP-N-acetylglucosamine 2-epimerase (non-hydrolyzing) [Actinomycetota bacterium]